MDSDLPISEREILTSMRSMIAGEWREGCTREAAWFEEEEEERVEEVVDEKELVDEQGEKSIAGRVEAKDGLSFLG